MGTIVGGNVVYTLGSLFFAAVTALWADLVDFFDPSLLATQAPTSNPTIPPTLHPTPSPTRPPTHHPTPSPSFRPTLRPTEMPSLSPSLSMAPSGPTDQPTATSWVQLGTDIFGEAAGDEMGWALAMSADGLTIVVGASKNDNENGINAGHVRAFHYNGADWEQLGQSVNGVSPFDGFGYAVTVSADGRTFAGTSPMPDSVRGHVRVFTWDATEMRWFQHGQTLEGEFEFDQLGFNLDLNANGTVLAAGGVYNMGLDIDAGHVRTFGYSADVGLWIQLGRDFDGQGRGDFYGRSVTLSADGRTLAIGAHRNDLGFTDAGQLQVFIYDLPSQHWFQLGNDIYGVAAGDRAGYAVDMAADGRTLVVGSYANDGNGYLAGHARVFTFDESVRDWVQVGQDLEGEAPRDEYGKAVSMTTDGKTIAIGGRKNDAGGRDAGHVRVFDFNERTSQWDQVGPDFDGDAEGDHFGCEQGVELSANGRILAVAGRFHDGNGRNSGHVRVFERF